MIADAQPYKRIPDERGGLEVRDTDKRFYDQMDASERIPDLANLDGGDGSDMLQGGPPIDLRPTDDEVDGSDPDNGMPNSVADEVAELADLSRPDRGIESEALAPMPAPRAPLPPPREVSPQFAFSEGGQYLVQVAAFRTQDAAEAAWRKSASEHPDLYRGAGKRIQRADLGAKGVFYRLRVGGFSQKTEADAFCDALKAEGDNCIVVTG